jgi:hypothetical protein
VAYVYAVKVMQKQALVGAEIGSRSDWKGSTNAPSMGDDPAPQDPGSDIEKTEPAFSRQPFPSVGVGRMTGGALCEQKIANGDMLEYFSKHPEKLKEYRERKAAEQRRKRNPKHAALDDALARFGLRSR